MKFNSQEQEAAYRRAMSHAYKAVAFDIDGTLTKLGNLRIPRKLSEKLGELAGKLPFIICSGRDIEHIKLKIHAITGRKKYFIVCENGGAGYVYDCKSSAHKQLFEVIWPDKIITAAELSLLLDKKFPWKIVVQARAHSVILYFHAFFYIFPPLVKKLSSLLARATKRFLEKEGLSEYFNIEDSGIGVIVLPQASGKGKAIKKISTLLKIPLRDFLVVGDMPEDGKNDCEFLSGKYGTAFTVGKTTSNIYPLPVYNPQGKKLSGPEGTYCLLKTLVI